jgi:hypothetical protein
MPINQAFGGSTYSIPVTGDLNWGNNLTRYLVALGNGAISPAGGNYPLTADLNFGTSFGLLAPYYKSSSANIATLGTLRLANIDTIDWRNFANSGNNVLAVNASDQLTYNGTPVATSGGGTVNLGTQYQLGYYATSSTVISGLTLITPNRALESDSNGLPVASGVTSATLAFLDATSSIQTQFNTLTSSLGNYLPLAGGTMSGAIGMGSNKITSLAAGTSNGNALAYGQSSPQFNDLLTINDTGSGSELLLTSLSSTNPLISFNTTGAGVIFRGGNGFSITGSSPTINYVIGTVANTGVAIHGTNTNDSPSAGYVGESFYSAVQSQSASTGAYSNITSITLSGGDWDVTGQVVFRANGATFTTSTFGAAVSAFSGNTTTDHVDGDNQLNDTVFSTELQANSTIAAWRASLATSTTIYLKGMATFSSGTVLFDGRISARRIR